MLKQRLIRLDGLHFLLGCLPQAPSYEKARTFATAQGWKLISEKALDKTGSMSARWEIASVGNTQVLLRLDTVVQPGWDIITCEVVFSRYRDSNKAMRQQFMEVVKSRPGGKIKTSANGPGADSLRIDYSDGALSLLYYDGLLADGNETPQVTLHSHVNRLQK